MAFGGLGNPITVLGSTTDFSADKFGAMAGRQSAVLAVFVPFILVGIAGGWKGLKQVWPAALTAGVTFGVCQFAFSNYWSYKLCDIFAALASAGAIIVLNRVWRPADALEERPDAVEERPDAVDDEPDSRAEVIRRSRRTR